MTSRLLQYAKRWLSKPTIRNSGAVLADQAAMSLAIFIAGVLVAREVTKHDYGLYVLGWSLISIVMGAHRALVVLPFSIFSPRLTENQRHAYQGSLLIHTAFLGGLAIAIIWGWIKFNGITSTADSTGELERILPLLSYLIFPYLVREYMRSALLAQLRFIDSALVNFSASLLMVSLLYGIYEMSLLTLDFAYIAIASSTAVAAILLTWQSRRSTLIRFNLLLPHLKYSFRLGRWNVLNVIAFTIGAQIFPWMLLFFEDTTSVAAYGACAAIAGLLGPFMRGVNAYILPVMVHNHASTQKEQGLFRILRKSILVLGIPFGLWLVAGIAFSEEILTFFYSNKYSGFGLLMVLMIVKNAIESISSPMTSALQTCERADVITTSLAVSALISVVSGILLIKGLGLTGAGIATVLSATITALWKWIVLLRIEKSGAHIPPPPQSM